MRIVEYRPEHLELIKPVEPLMRQKARIVVPFYAGRGPALSIVNGHNKVFAVCGVCLSFWQGIGEAWAVVSQEADENPMGIIRAFRRGVEYIENTTGLRRVQATVRSDWGQGVRFVKLLGFEFEGRLRAYGPDGRDHDMYSRVKI